jgi:hypothetical protein
MRVGFNEGRAALCFFSARWFAAFFLAVFASVVAQAATHRYEVFLDLDRSASTGCTVASGAATGIERIVRITVNTTSTAATVSAIERLDCISGSNFGAAQALPGAPYALAPGGAGGGVSAIEFNVAMASLPTNPDPTQPTIIRLGASSLSSSSASDNLLPLADFQLRTGTPNSNGTNSVPVPFSPLYVLVIFALLIWAISYKAIRQQLRRVRNGVAANVLGVLIAGTFAFGSASFIYAIVLDGNIGDWSGSTALITDPQGDQPANADLVALHAKVDGGDLALRVDAVVQLEPVVIGNLAPTISGLSDATISLPTYRLAFAPNVTDDGLPAPSTLTYQWTRVSGPAPVAFGNDIDTPPDLSTDAKAIAAQSSTRRTVGAFFDFETPGTYVLRFTASDGSLSSSRDVTVTVNPALSAAPQIGPLSNRTIPLGQTLGVSLPGRDANQRDTLTYSLLAAPSGASLTPSNGSRFSFTPTASQIGSHNVTVQVRDQNNQTAQASFTINVTNANRAPVLTQPSDRTASTTAALSIALSATDPDNDTLTYALVSGPSGMSIAGNTLLWTPSAAQLGNYAVIVSARDLGGLFDVKQFNIRVGSNAAPVARNDRYEVRTGETLTVNATNGVLANDVDPDGVALTASKSSDPARGTLTEFASDGSFTYQAPAVATPPRLQVKKRWAPIPEPFTAGGTNYGGLLIGDIDKDGVSDIIRSWQSGYRAYDGSTGAVKWTQAPPCFDYLVRSPGSGALVDLDDDGELEFVSSRFASSPCNTGGYAGTALFAINARTGAVKWTGPAVEPLMADHQGGPAVAETIAALRPLSLTAARIAASEKPKIVFSTTTGARGGAYVRTDGSITEAGCRAFSGRAEDNAIGCRITYIANGETGAIEHRLVSPHANATLSSYHAGPYPRSEIRQEAPIAIDLDGDGVAEIIARGDVWKQTGGVWSLWWKSDWSPVSTAVADLDGDGKLEVIMAYPWAISEGALGAPYGIHVFTAEGQLKRRIPLPGSLWNGELTIADVDGDGAPEIVIARRGQVHAIKSDGHMLWTYDVPDKDGVFDGQPIVAPLTAPPPAGVGRDAREFVAAEERTKYTVPAVYDLNGDGIKDVIVSTASGVFFLDGRTGQPQAIFGRSASDGNGTNYGFEIAAVIDVDGDGQAEVVVTSGCPYRLFQGEGDGVCDEVFAVLENANPAQPWLPAPRQWGQMSFAEGQISDGGRLNVSPTNSRSYRAPTQRGTIVDSRASDKTSFTYTASDGALTSNTATVTIDLLPPNRPPKITSAASTTFVNQAVFSYQITAADPDAGDTLTYSVTRGASCGNPGTLVNASTGLVTCPGGINNGGGLIDTLTVRVTDSQGAFDEQTILLVVLGPAAAVPSLLGQTRADAELTLASALFVPGTVTEIHNAAAAGTIILQTPNAGTSTPTGSFVDFTISKGPQPVVVPNVVGLSETLARSRLTALGFTVDATRQFAPQSRGEVLSQNIAAGQLVVAGAISLNISSGTGLELRLSSTAITAGTALTLIPLAFDASGNPSPTPALTYVVSALQSPHLGALPTVAGTTLSAPVDTLGSFKVTATDTATGRSASANFVVLLPLRANGLGSGGHIAKMFSALESMEQIGIQLRAARAANDEPLMRNLLTQYVNTWRTVDPEQMKWVTPFALPRGFMSDTARLATFGLSAQPNDVLIQQILREGSDDLREWTRGLRASGTTLTELNQLADRFSTRAARLGDLTISEFGAVMSAEEIIGLISRDMPDFYEALTDDLGVVVGLPRRSSRFPEFRRSTQKSALAEQLITIAVDTVVEKVIEQANQTYANAKQFAKDSLAFAAYSAAATAAFQHLKEEVQAKDVVEVVSGASLSFRVFRADLTFVEVLSQSRRADLFNVTVIGPSLFLDVNNGVRDLHAKLQEATSYARDVLTNPNRVRNIDDLQDIHDEFLKRVTAVTTTATGAYQEITQGVFQIPTAIERTCVFTTAPCRQLLYDNGFKSVYKYKPPPGFVGVGGLPVPIIFMIYDMVTGESHFALIPFLPTVD